MRRFSLCVLLSVAALWAGTCGAQQRADSLGDVPGMLQTPEARAVWREQMQGAPMPDRLGTTALAGLDRQQLIDALLPEGGGGDVRLLGARAWAERPGHVVAIVCTGSGAPHPVRQICETSAARAVVGVLHVQDDGRPRLVARLDLSDAIDLPDLWSTDVPVDATPQDPSTMPASWEGFDLAAYRLRDGDAAFGLRGRWSDSYAGGGASYSALYLFEIRGDALALVFAAPMSVYQDIAGDWNDDGTRQHHITDWARLLIVQPRTRSGYHDLLLRERGTPGGGTRYVWSPTAREYRKFSGR